MIAVDDIRWRYHQAEAFLDERGRRLFAANEAQADGFGGVTAAAAATGSAASDVLANARELDNQSGTLRNAVDGFLAKIRAA